MTLAAEIPPSSRLLGILRSAAGVAGVAGVGPDLHDAWRAHFEATAGREPRFSVGVELLRTDVAESLKRIIPREAKVLEIGAGDGSTLAALPQKLREGIDYTPAAVEAARKWHPDVRVELDDALSFQRSARYDAIICDRIVHSVGDIQQLLTNASTHLANGGRIYLTCFNFLWEKAIRGGEVLGFKHPTPEANWLSEADLENLFTCAGLEVVKYEDRLLLPLPLPLLSTAVNRYIGKLPGVRWLSLYRLYALRKKAEPAPRTPRVSVIVPARNESGNVPNIIARTPMMGAGTELIFVEGGSTDDTAAAIEREIAAYKGPLKLASYQQTGKGKGDAVRLGFSKATGELLMILDADLTVPPEDLPKFYTAAVRGLGEYLHGTRLVYPMESEAMQFLNKLGNIGFSRLFTYLLNQRIRDTLCGTKVLWRRDYERIAANRDFFGDFDPFGDFDLIFGASKLNLKVVEIPVRYRNRTYGETNISRWRHGWLLLKMSVVAARKLKFV